MCLSFFTGLLKILSYRSFLSLRFFFRKPQIVSNSSQTKFLAINLVLHVFYATFRTADLSHRFLSDQQIPDLISRCEEQLLCSRVLDHPSVKVTLLPTYNVRLLRHLNLSYYSS